MKTHDDWVRLDTLLFCNICKHWLSVRSFKTNNSNFGVFPDRYTKFYYDLPENIKEEAWNVYTPEKNMLDWNNIGMSAEIVNLINSNILNKEQYIRFVVMEFYINPKWNVGFEDIDNI